MMDEPQAETEDSRTSAVGRKRDLAAFEPSHEPSSDHSDDSAERSHKRAKQELEVVHDESAQDPALASASVLQAGLHQPAPAEAPPIAPPPITWNKGVQSGLRTSFASRGLSQSKAPEPAPKPEPNDGGDGPAIGNVAMVLATDSSQASSEHGPSSNVDSAIQPSLPTQPRADIGKSKSKKARNKKGQVTEQDTNGNKEATKNALGPKPAPVQPRDPQLPRVPSLEDPPKYKNANGEFALDLIIRDNEQVKLKDLTPELFAMHFLAGNAGKLEKMSAKHIRGAFSTYLRQYYGHLPAHVLDATRESNAKESKSFAQCLDLARKTVNDGGIIELPKKGGKAQLAKVKPPKTKQSKTNLSQADPKLSGLSGPVAGVSLGGSENHPASTLQQPSATADDIPLSEDAEAASPETSLESEREEGEMSSDALEIVLSDLEIELLQKYFPSIPGNGARPTCLACAGSNHKTFDCPSLSCKICGKYHTITTCPENVRCLKCRARGHLAKDCPEKLYNPPSEGECCDLCQSTDHLENACHMLWRSYKPRPEDIKRVRDIPVSCYVCGASNHYGPECGLHNGKILSGGVTWSRANLQMYLDPSSSDRAICAGKDLSLPKPGKKVFNIRGQADEPIMLDDSDDDVEFLHASVKPSLPKSQPRGTIQKIHLAGNQIPMHGPAPGSYQAPSGPRQGRSQFGDHNGFQDSARYGRERAFSPPPRATFNVGFNENERYLPQPPARGEYRPSDGGRRPGDKNFRGGQLGRGRGGGSTRGGGGGRGRKRGKSSK